MIEREAQDVIDFWLKAGPKKWWRKDLEFDEEIREKFGKLHQRASAGQLDHWREESTSCIALVLVLDQFSRNLFRGDAKAFAQDEQALEMAKYAVKNGFDRDEPINLYEFFYLPFMHSEILANQQKCVSLYESRYGADGGTHAKEHRDIIEKFGRFPHRNPVLEREMTPDEQAFLDQGGFKG